MTERDQEPDAPFFVSRRGRQVGVHQVDLSDIDIDHDEPVRTATALRPAKKTAAPKGSSTTTPGRRRIKTIIVVGILMCLVAPFAIGEAVAAQYRGGSEAAQKELSVIVSKTVLPAQKHASVSAGTIRSSANQVNAIVGRMCRGGLMDNAATLYPRANAALAACKKSQAHYASLASNLYTLEAQARYLETLGGYIKPIATPITDEYAVIGAQQDMWRTAVKGIKKIAVPVQMQSAHTLLLEHAEAIAQAWSDLNTANNDQDAEAFTAAEQKLAAEYEAMRAASGEFTAIIAATQAKVTQSYVALQ